MDAKLLGQRIREARERRGLSQDDFAALIARDQRAVSEYEHGKRRIAVTELPTFARVLNVPLLYFFEGEIETTDLDRAMLDQVHRLPSLRAQQAAVDLVRILSDTLHED